MESGDEGSEECAVCTCELSPPFIRCRQCPGGIGLCLSCFARGAQVGAHHNDHRYSIVRNDFPLYENHWTAAEELSLLNAVESVGYGNWSDVSAQLTGKSERECERHYNKCFISRPQSPLPKFPEYEPDFVPTPVLFKLSDNPPRPPEGSPMSREMAGYSAPRGEFAVEHNNFAELDICNISFDEGGRHHGIVGDRGEDDKEEEEEDMVLMNEMKMAMLLSYHEVVKERHRRKRIIRKYGLINLRSTLWQQHVHEAREVNQAMTGLQVFTRLMSPLRNDMLLAVIAHEKRVKAHIRDLQDCRQNGLKHLRSISLYKLLSNRRSMAMQRRHLLTDVLSHVRDEAVCQTWLKKQAAAGDKTFPLPSVPRKAAMPLVIDGMPGYERLLPSEKELCETYRLTPQAYLDYSFILINEARKNGGGLRLAQARLLIKIDVNKTRKIFDFLVHEGKIKKLER